MVTMVRVALEKRQKFNAVGLRERERVCVCGVYVGGVSDNRYRQFQEVLLKNRPKKYGVVASGVNTRNIHFFKMGKCTACL